MKKSTYKFKFDLSVFISIIALILSAVVVVTICLFISVKESQYKTRIKNIESNGEVAALSFDRQLELTKTKLKSYTNYVDSTLKNESDSNVFFEKANLLFQESETELFLVDETSKLFYAGGKTNIPAAIFGVDNSVYLTASFNEVYVDFEDIGLGDKKYDMLYFIRLPYTFTLYDGTEASEIRYCGIAKQSAQALNILVSSLNNECNYSIFDSTGKNLNSVVYLKNASFGKNVIDSLDKEFKLNKTRTEEILAHLASQGFASFECSKFGENYMVSMRQVGNSNYYIAFLMRSVNSTNGAFAGSPEAMIFITVLVVLAVLGTGVVVLFTVKTRDTGLLLKQEQEMNKTLVENNKAKTDFLGRMSHDLRTPINIIKGFTDVTLSEEQLSDKGKDNLLKIDEATKQLLTLVNNLLEVSNNDNEDAELASKPFDLRRVIDNVVSITKQKIGDKKLEFEVSISDVKHFQLCGDENKLKTIFINLLDNAVKFSKPIGKITLVLRETFSNENYMSLQARVIDNGIGMSETFAKDIGTAFAQENADQVRTRIGGAGLGLKIVNNYLNKMGGSLKVQSVKGEGSTFTFTCSFDVIKEGHKVEIPEYKDLENLKVLIVEDNDLNLELAVDLLEMQKAVVDTARDGAEALEKIRSSEPNTYDVILMDIMMPNMNGIDATKAIRKLPRADSITIPIIAMTANVSKDDMEKTMNAGMDAHLSKPIDIQTVVKVINKVVRR